MTPNATAAVADPLTERTRAIWTAGDFGRIALGYRRGAAEFIARLGITPGEQLLDAACGTGNLALPAARAGARVTGIDIAPNLLAQLQESAGEEALEIRMDEGNCERLPYANDSFDTVVSMFGVMFAARPELAAAELVRVCRTGGRVALASWTPRGFVGDMLRTTAAYVPPPAGMASPLLWGDARVAAERLGTAGPIRTTSRLMTFEYPLPPAGVVDYFRNWYGPTKRAFDALDAERAESLHHDLVQLWAEHNRARDGSTRVESEYLEVIVTVGRS